MLDIHSPGGFERFFVQAGTPAAALAPPRPTQVAGPGQLRAAIEDFGAQVVGPPWFGEMTEYRPIMQKGDRFYDPFHHHYVRYSPQTLKVPDGRVKPKLTVEHQILADSDINGPTYENSRE